MICPLCKENLKKALFYGLKIDYCPICLGMFFEKDELRLAKDQNLRWLDIDLWPEKEKFAQKKSKTKCPKCRLFLNEVNCGDSQIKVDLCYFCKGIWLDRQEFKKIVDCLKEKANFELFRNWAQNFKKEFWEIFTGPEIFRKELLDFLILLKFLVEKFLFYSWKGGRVD